MRRYGREGGGSLIQSDVEAGCTAEAQTAVGGQLFAVRVDPDVPGGDPDRVLPR